MHHLRYFCLSIYHGAYDHLHRSLAVGSRLIDMHHDEMSMYQYI